MTSRNNQNSYIKVYISALSKTDHEDMKRRVDIVSKSIGKAERDAYSLKEAIARQEGGMETLQKATADNQKKIQEATDEKEEEDKQREKVEEEVRSLSLYRRDGLLFQVIAAEKIVNELKTAGQENNEENEKTRSQLGKLDDLLEVSWFLENISVIVLEILCNH